MQYSRTLGASLKDLSEGPDVVGVRVRDDISPGLYSLHVARKGRKGRHIVLYRASVSGEEAFVDVLRILHDSMDIMTHLPVDLTDRAKD
ncbi:type II toxin-antitoxin system RelE/ParE family toxin [Skermanella sp. TT6]|uniref:Type II toxin-antitoxin system RelE/ParE family toxin n=1 Tax=Skermanella cutis TaxID=2775420 RepID=A0ABX7BA88_9PROT|nr:type II toxin-antitoxin system RelE/ParE family toxin [Skermanella sp. TT6]